MPIKNKPLGVHQLHHARFVMGRLDSAHLYDFALLLHELCAGPGFDGSDFKDASSQLVEIVYELAGERRETMEAQNDQ